MYRNTTYVFRYNVRASKPPVMGHSLFAARIKHKTLHWNGTQISVSCIESVTILACKAQLEAALNKQQLVSSGRYLPVARQILLTLSRMSSLELSPVGPFQCYLLIYTAYCCILVLVIILVEFYSHDFQ